MVNSQIIDVHAYFQGLKGEGPDCCYTCYWSHQCHRVHYEFDFKCQIYIDMENFNTICKNFVNRNTIIPYGAFE